MAKKEYGRLHFRLTADEKDLLDQVIARMGYESKTSWLRSHLRADCIACGFEDLDTEDEQALLSMS